MTGSNFTGTIIESGTTVTTSQITQVRRMTAELTTAIYSDAQIQVYIEAHPLTDIYGFGPDDPQGIYDVNPDWTPTYDLNAAAADIWEEKAGVVTVDFDMNADGGNFSRSQVYEQMMKQARHYRSRRSVKTINLQPSPKSPLINEEMDDDETV